MTSIIISYLGLSCFKFEVKDHQEAVFVTDPFSKTDGLKLPRNLAADFVTISSKNPLHNAVEFVKPMSEKSNLPAQAGLKIVSHPGEYEIKGIFINGIPSVTADKDGKILHKNTVFNFLIGDVQVVHLGNLAKSLSNEEIQELGNSDVLLLPISSDPETKNGAAMSARGGSALSGKNLIDIIARVEPRIVIPMHYKMPDLKINLNSLDKFLKEIGQTKTEPIKKFKFSKKDLPQEEMKVIILSKS